MRYLCLQKNFLVEIWSEVVEQLNWAHSPLLFRSLAETKE